MTATGALPLGQAAQLLGCYRWMEHRLFELTGAWASEMPLPAAQVLLAESSFQHAWHAQLFAERLPALDGIDHQILTRPFGPAVAPLFAALAGEQPGDGPDDPLGAARGVVQRLVGLHRVVLPRLVTTYDRHLELTTPATDGPTVRALTLARTDLVATWRAGETLLQEILARPHDVAAAAAAAQRLEGVVVATGVGAGLVPLPSPHPL